MLQLHSKGKKGMESQIIKRNEKNPTKISLDEARRALVIFLAAMRLWLKAGREFEVIRSSTL